MKLLREKYREKCRKDLNAERNNAFSDRGGWGYRVVNRGGWGCRVVNRGGWGCKIVAEVLQASQAIHIT